MLVEQALKYASVDPEVFSKSRAHYDHTGDLNMALAPVFEADARDRIIPDVKLSKDQTLKAIMHVTDMRFDQIEKMVEAGVSRRYDHLVRLAVSKNLRSYFADQLFLKYGIEEKDLE